MKNLNESKFKQWFNKLFSKQKVIIYFNIVNREFLQ